MRGLPELILRSRGRIVSIEGVDAAGKHTQSVLLEEWLKNIGLGTALFSFPDYNTSVGREIKSLLSARKESLPQLRHILFAANRWEKAAEIVERLESGDIVVINRYSESNLVYGLANGLSLGWLRSIERGIPKSDLVLVLDAPPGALSSRRPGEKDSYEKNSELQVRAQELYQELASKFGWVLIDGNRQVESVHKSVIAAVRKSLTAWGLDRR